MKTLPHYQWLCQEIEETLRLSGTQMTDEERAEYRARVRELIGRAQSHLQDSIAQMRAIEAEL